MNTKFYTVSEIQGKNFKGLKDFQANLNNTSVILYGSEATGKTNVWLLIQTILGKYPSAVVTKSEDGGEATIKIDKQDTHYEFEFTFSRDGKHKLTTYVDGVKITKAKQAYVIEQLMPNTVDIDKLIHSTASDQLQFIKEMFGVDTRKEEADYQKAYDERRMINRTLKDNPEPRRVSKVKPVDVDQLTQEYRQAKEQEDTLLRKYQESLQREKDKQRNIDQSQELLAQLRERKQELLEELARLDERIQSGVQHMESLPKPQKIVEPLIENKSEELLQKLNEAHKINSNYSEYLSYVKAKEHYYSLLKQSQMAEEAVLDVRQSIVDKLAAINFPVEGLELKTELDDNGKVKSKLYYNDLPFDDDSINTSKKYAIAAKLQIEQFQENQLAVMHVNASYMSEQTIKDIADECAKLGVQCLFEVTSRKTGEQLTIKTTF